MLKLWPEVLLSFWICPGIVLRWCNLCQHMHTVKSIPALWDEKKRANGTRIARRTVCKYSGACGMCSWQFRHFTLILPLVIKITLCDGSKNNCSNYNRKIILLQHFVLYFGYFFACFSVRSVGGKFLILLEKLENIAIAFCKWYLWQRDYH